MGGETRWRDEGKGQKDEGMGAKGMGCQRNKNRGTGDGVEGQGQKDGTMDEGTRIRGIRTKDGGQRGYSE